ncbi:Superfamily I DNA or RNA helicase [Lutibacter agarilyticus]|uniref:DNA 3'-5' helicase n=1 Tax=Lutibacter agarilyticus TaxID=1109740 RepID=A0A238WWK5_9FLAO|nr:ATP-dependent helicase [Lutibacter agarilyticus]SNR50907.1 Superfamily I DNA or RNA helicase [Lutibacter agarilyticus]
MKLNKNQRKAVFELIGSALITASPGTGKTRTLVARAINKLETLPKHKSIALITYTNAGADEIASRLITEKPVFVGTIHSFCLEYILRPFSWLNKWKRPKVISYEQQEEFFEVNEDIDLEGNFGQNKFDELGKIGKNLDGSLNSEIEWNHSIPIQEVALRYYDYQTSIGVMDFNEILYRSYYIVTNNSFVCKSLSSKFHEILVDEFQDTNLYQYKILKSINDFGTCTFFMVGDSKQRIFSFAGAIKKSFEQAKIDFNSEQLELTETYRSTDNIVNTYSKLFEDHPIIDNKSDNSRLDIDVTLIQTKKDNHLEYVNSIVNQLIEKENIELNEIAVLSTSWFSAYPLSQSLRQNHRIVGLGALPHKYISNSTTSLLRILAKHYLEPSIRKLRSIKRNIEMHLLENGLQLSEKELTYKTNTLITNFLLLNSDNNIVAGFCEIKKMFHSVFKITHATFDEILDKISTEEKQTWTIGEYLETLAGVNGINCNTIHKVKGLEFDAVILNEMNENKIPFQKFLGKEGNDWIYQELSEEDIENGKNLFYVAVSRAKKYLIILHNWKPSMFINIIRN